MERFDLSDQGTDLLGSPRLQAFNKAMWDALVPSSGKCVSVQGELIRANERLQSEYLRNGLGNYYTCPSDSVCRGDAENLQETFYGELFVLILDTLSANRNAALDANDVAYFVHARGLAHSDWLRNHRMVALEEKLNDSELSEEETRELEQLGKAEGPDWEPLFNRAQRCIANWCIANPELIDREGNPVEEGGVRNVEHVFEPPPPPPPCPLCRGRGWLPPRDATQFPEVCSCKRISPS